MSAVFHTVIDNTAPMEIPDVAYQIAEQYYLCDMPLFSDWLACEDHIRRHSQFFGPISTDDLFALILFNPGATDAQRKAACEEIRRRYLMDKSEYIERKAKEVML